MLGKGHIGESPCAHVLTSSLVPPAKRKAWVGSPAEKLKRMDTDKDMDVFVSGLEV